MKLEVVDNGPGIAADLQRRLFVAFDRLGAEGGAVEGTGIGLVISKRIVEAMGGTIGFSSREGEGSRFWIELPVDESRLAESLVVAAEEVKAVVAEAKAGQGGGAGRPIVLYVEDNPVNLKLMQYIFARRPDLQLRDAPTAEIGLDLAQTLMPALILMDINLPGMSGYDAIERLKANELTRHIPVVALTANAMKGDAERGRQAGFDDYLTKPVDIDALLRTLEGIK